MWIGQCLRRAYLACKCMWWRIGKCTSSRLLLIAFSCSDKGFRDVEISHHVLEVALKKSMSTTLCRSTFYTRIMLRPHFLLAEVACSASDWILLLFAKVKSQLRCEQYQLGRVCTRFTCLQTARLASLNMPRFLETMYWHLLLKCFTEVLEAKKIHLHLYWTLFRRTLSIFDIDCIMCKFKVNFFARFRSTRLFCYCAQLPSRLAVHPECVCTSVGVCISCMRKYFPCAEICACHTKMVVVHFTRTAVAVVRGCCSVLGGWLLCWTKWTRLPHSCLIELATKLTKYIHCSAMQ